MKWIRKNLKWIILGLTIFFAIIISFTDCPKLHAALALITPVLMSFLSNNEKLTAMQIAKIEKEEREQEENKKFEKMLNLVKKIVCDICRKAEFDKDVIFTEDKIIQLIKGDNLNKKEKIIRNIIFIKLPVKINIFVYFMNLGGSSQKICPLNNTMYFGYPFHLIIKKDECIFQFKNMEFYFPDDNHSEKEIIYSHNIMFSYVFDNSIFLSGNIDEIKFEQMDLEKLKQELPKILTPDVFDGEKLIV